MIYVMMMSRKSAVLRWYRAPHIYIFIYIYMMMSHIHICDDDVPKVSSTAIIYSTTYMYICYLSDD